MTRLRRAWVERRGYSIPNLAVSSEPFDFAQDRLREESALEKDRVSDDMAQCASRQSLSYDGNRFFAYAQNDNRVVVRRVAFPNSPAVRGVRCSE